MDLGKYNISGTIKNQDGQPASGVLVRLKLLVPQDSSAASDQDEDEKNIIQFKNGIRKIFIPDSAKSLQLLSFNAYARTDASGKFIFSGLPENKSYEIIPLQPGYEFGRSQGIEKLQSDATFNFVGSPHMIRLFSAKDFNTFKKEKAFIVRTPEEVTQWFRIIVITFFSSFLLLHLIFSIRSPATDQLLTARYYDINRPFFYNVVQSAGSLTGPLPGKKHFYLFLHRDGGYIGTPVYQPEKVYT